MAAPTQAEARRGAIFGAYLKLSAPFLFIIPGMLAFALAKQGQPGHEAFEALRAGENTNQAYPLMVRQHGTPTIVLHCDDTHLAGQILRAKAFNLLGEGDLAAGGADQSPFNTTT